LGADKEVFLYEGIPHPVKCDKIRYYQDKRFTQRVLPKVAIPPLEIGQVQTNTEARTRPAPPQQTPQQESDVNIKQKLPQL
jgi:type IV secretory pathway TraG/TraD family ATPase VirD4